MKGGKTSKTEAKNIKERKIKTRRSDNGLGIFKIFCILLVKLQIMFAMTKAQIIRRRKSLRLQNNRRQIVITNVLKKKELFNFY